VILITLLENELASSKTTFLNLTVLASIKIGISVKFILTSLLNVCKGYKTPKSCAEFFKTLMFSLPEV